MYNIYPMILGIIDQLNEWNEKINSFVGEHMDNVVVGTRCWSCCCRPGFSVKSLQILK